MPTVEVDPVTKETRWTSFSSDIYIHERQQSRDGVTHHQKHKHAGLNAIDPLDARLASGYEPTSSTSKTFVISGVIDPKTGHKLSMAQALARGIINRDTGMYTNPDTGESISIAEAIARGLITVDYADKLTNGSLLHNGDAAAAGMLNELETKSYAISGVIDPRTGEMISVAEAVAAGMLDPVTGEFTNPVTGEKMSLLDAVRAGYLLADPSLLADLDPADDQSFTSVSFEEVKLKVAGVVDPRTGREISLQDAIEAGIIDPQQGTYRNPVTGEVGG